MRSRMWVLITLLLTALAATACGAGARTAPTPTPARSARAPRPTFTLTPTKAPATATMAPTATNTLVPSPTVTPTLAATATFTPAPAGFTSNATANVRQGPGTGYPIIGQIQAGQEMAITGKDPTGGWWQFNYNGDSGWVSNQMVTANSGAAAVAVAENIPAAPTQAPRPAAPAAAPAAPAQPTQPAAPATQYMLIDTNPRVNTNPFVTVWCLVWNPAHNDTVGGTIRVTGPSGTKEVTFQPTRSTANGGLPSQFKYNTGCKIELSPATEGQYTAWLISGPGGQPVSDPAVLPVAGKIHEFATVWQQK
jgi:hypothetical protein